MKIVFAGLGTAAMVFVPSASADVPGLAPFVGTWQKHGEKLVIDNAGTGVDTYPDLTVCPGCSDADAPTGTLTFTLTPTGTAWPAEASLPVPIQRSTASVSR
jgi:hypothetical protein